MNCQDWSESMSDRELKEFIEALRRVQEEHAATPEAARRLLVESGILTEQGEVAEPYR